MEVLVGDSIGRLLRNGHGSAAFSVGPASKLVTSKPLHFPAFTVPWKYPTAAWYPFSLLE